MSALDQINYGARRIVMTRLRTSLLMALGALGAVGCSAQGNNAMIVMNIAVPEGDDCTVDPSGETFSSQGLYDMERGGEFFVPVRLQGTLEADPNAGTRHHIVLRGANVSLIPGPSERSEQLIAGLGDLAQRTVLTSGTLPPGDGSRVSVSLTLIDSEQTAALAASSVFEAGVQVVASFKVFGTVDGNDVESYAFNYPITLCADCVLDLGDCPPDPDTNEPITELDDCVLPPEAVFSRGSTCFGDQIP